MNKIRIATVGVGRFGKYHLHAFKQLERKSDVILVAAAEIDKEKQEIIANEFNLKVYDNYLEMIENEDLDAVSVATEDYLHKEIVINCLKKGLHVFVEKPLDTSAVGAFEMVQTAMDRDILLQVDFHKRYDPYHIEIKQLIEQNKIGELLYGYCYMEDQIVVPRDWFSSWVSHSSPMWFLGSNFIDLFVWLMNSKVKSVYAVGQKNKLIRLGIDTYDSIKSMLTFENNAVITFDTSWILPENFSAIVNQGFRIVGTEGIIEADSHNRGTSSCFSSESGVRNHNSGFMQQTKDIDGNINYEGYGINSIYHFVENVKLLKTGKIVNDLEGFYPSGLEGYEVSKIIQAIHNSLKSGEKINLEKEEHNVSLL